MTYNPILGPPRYELEEFNQTSLLVMHDIMGFSCLWFAFPILGLMFAAYLDEVDPCSSILTSACFCIFMFNTAFWSIMGDYYPARFAERPEQNVRVAWWEKMQFCGFMDNIFAKASLVLAVAIYMVQLACGGRFWQYTPMALVVCIAVVAKTLGGRAYRKYDHDKNESNGTGNPNTIW